MRNYISMSFKKLFFYEYKNKGFKSAIRVAKKTIALKRLSNEELAHLYMKSFLADLAELTNIGITITLPEYIYDQYWLITHYDYDGEVDLNEREGIIGDLVLDSVFTENIVYTRRLGVAMSYQNFTLMSNGDVYRLSGEPAAAFEKAIKTRFHDNSRVLGFFQNFCEKTI